MQSIHSHYAIQNQTSICYYCNEYLADVMTTFSRILTAIIIMQYSINLLILRLKHVEKLISRKFLHILRDRELRTEPPINRLENSIIEKEV